MWLLPVFSPVARAAAYVYYRIRYAGDAVPATGPVLLVANHPNSLLDPTIVVAAARRPVRFLAKAPLFDDTKIGWAVKAAGSIPVYRKHDEGAQMSRNVDAFHAVYDVLASGGAVGIFPEGISHNEPALAPLKTGAARIALGAAQRIGGAFPIVPIGLVLREKDVFRSEALAYRGTPVVWDDLASRGQDNAEAVRELTQRVATALRSVTVNLEAWEDGPLVECAVRVWESERRAPATAAERVDRLRTTARILADFRASGAADGERLSRDVEAYRRQLARIGLRPADVAADVRLSRAMLWAARRIHVLVPLELLLAGAGGALFWVPYQLTGQIVRRIPLEVDVRSTWKLLIGLVTYIAWVGVLAAVAGLVWGIWSALALLVVVPAVGVLGLHARQHWRSAWDDARRFFLLRSRQDLVAGLRARQRELGDRLDAAYHTFLARGVE
ncbi:MAG: 1-acyl-sn-glycerol-3-phosphate acyltransferase [Gemmatimonadaceae bacterium]